MREVDIQREIIEFLESLGALVLRMNAGKARYNYRGVPNGTPDLLVIFPDGRIFWIEVKQPGNGLSQEQRVMRNRLQMRGQTVLVVSSIKQLEEGLELGSSSRASR